MKQRPILALVAVAATLVLSAPASALEFTGGGGRIGFLEPDAGDGGVALGAHVELESPGSRWHLQPNILYWNGDPLTGFDGNLDAFYHFGAPSQTAPYLGAGLGFSMVDVPGNGGSNTDPAANLFGGVMFPAGRNNVFLEGRYTISDVNQASVLFGFTVR
jgi:hypothetical protein